MNRLKLEILYWRIEIERRITGSIYMLDDLVRGRRRFRKPSPYQVARMREDLKRYVESKSDVVS